jgi:hypothetical protein
MVDNYIKYNLSRGKKVGCGGGGGGDGLSDFLCMIAGFLELFAFFKLFDLEVEDVPGIIIIILWIVFSLITAVVAHKLKP